MVGLGAGRNQLPVAAQSAAMGGHIRVGLEDSLWLAPGILAKSNADQVRPPSKLLNGLGLRPATPAEARAQLALKGMDRVHSDHGRFPYPKLSFVPGDATAKMQKALASGADALILIWRMRWPRRQSRMRARRLPHFWQALGQPPRRNFGCA